MVFVTAAEAQTLLDAREAKGAWRVGSLEAEGKVWAHDPTALGGPSVGEVCLFNANPYRPHNGNRALAAAAPNLAATVVAQAADNAALRTELAAITAHGTMTRDEIERLTDEAKRAFDEAFVAKADNATLRAELDDLRGRLSRTAARLADLERAGAALDFDATLAALRRVPVRQWCGRCGEERTRWCAGCGYCETTCCVCPGGIDANGSEVPCG